MHDGKAEVLSGIVGILADIGYVPVTSRISEEDVKDSVSSWVAPAEAVMRMFVGRMAGVPLPKGVLTESTLSFDEQEFRDVVAQYHSFASAVMLRYDEGNPLSVPIVIADDLNDDDFVRLVDDCERIMLELRHFGLGESSIFHSKAGASHCDIVFVFFDKSCARRYLENLHSSCHRFHFWKESYLRPWAVDVESRTVRPPAKLGRGILLKPELSELQDRLF